MGDSGQTRPSGREALVQRALFVIVALVLPFGIAASPLIFNDGDTSWHVAAGRWILAHGQIPTTDPFSFTAAGRRWVAMEWPADIVMAAAYGAAGLAGLAALVAAALIALHVIVFAHLQRRASPIVIVGTLLALDLAISPFILARPHILVWPLLALWTALLARASETGKPPPLWAALLLVVWTNLHGSFPLALVIGAGLAFDALVKGNWATLRQWLVFAGVCLVAICINANGVTGLLQPFRVAQLQTLHLIQEWQPSSPTATPLFYAVLLAGLGAMLWRGTRVPQGRLALLLAMLALAFSQQRHQSWFVITAALLVPPLFATRGESVAKLAPLALLAVPLLLVRALWPITPPESASNPRSLLAHVPAELKSQPVFNEYSFGGPLILAGIRPYIDGRSEMYGDAFVIDYNRIGNGDWDRFNEAVKRYNIRWTMLPAGDSKLMRDLDHSPQWRRIYADKVGVIHVRTR
jgi:hypothetical protein